MRYTIIFDPGALREFDKLPDEAKARLSKMIDSLADEPHPQGSTKMSSVDAYRIRAGEYRAVYAIKDKQLIILIVKVGHRRNVYEDLGLVKRRLKN